LGGSPLVKPDELNLCITLALKTPALNVLALDASLRMSADKYIATTRIANRRKNTE
jgi:hypothetical protein